MAYNTPPTITGFMPESIHKDDRQWVFSKVRRLVRAKYFIKEKDLRFLVCLSYTTVFNKAYKNEPLRHRKMGKARFAANSRLRAFIDNKFKVSFK